MCMLYAYNMRMKLRAFLRENNISVADFCDSIGVSRDMAYAYMNGKKRPSLETFSKIQEVSNNAFTPEDFLTRT